LAESRNYAPARGKVVVWEWPDGRVEIEYRGRAVRWREIPAPSKPSVPEAKAAIGGASALTPHRAKRKWVPPADHPWRQAAQRIGEESVQQGQGRDAAVVSLAHDKNRYKKPKKEQKTRTTKRGHF